jgi:hypothetical protein
MAVQKKKSIQKRKKGVKGQKGIPTTEYGELKKTIKLTLTPTAIGLLEKITDKQKISRTELIEQLSRNPLLYLDWIRLYLNQEPNSDWRWMEFYEAVEKSICTRHSQTVRQLSAPALLKLIQLEDLEHGLSHLNSVVPNLELKLGTTKENEN